MSALIEWLHRMGLHINPEHVQAATDQATQAGQQAAQAMAQMDMPALLALSAALGWVSGFRLYAVVFFAGLAGLVGWIPLPPGLHLLQHPAVLATSGALLFTEFFADKIPGLDSLWDMANSVIRIPAGAALAAGAFGLDQGVMTMVAALLGGTLATSSQLAKSTTRAAINTSPEPFSNIGMSLVEDVTAVGALWLATQHPLVFAVLLTLTVIALAVLTWVLLKFLSAVLRRLRSFFSSKPSSTSSIKEA